MILFVFMVALDMGGNGLDVFLAAGMTRERAVLWGYWVGTVEESLKICIEAALLGSMYNCAFIARAVRSGSGGE